MKTKVRSVTFVCLGLLLPTGIWAKESNKEEVRSSPHEYHCAAVAGAGVEHTLQDNIKANVYDVSLLKLRIHKSTSGWQVFEGQDKEPILSGCESQYRCFPKTAFFSIFQMNKDHIFTYVIQKAYGDDLSRQIIYSFKGTCLIQQAS